jgi:hypothetical protein
MPSIDLICLMKWAILAQLYDDVLHRNLRFEKYDFSSRI